MSSFSLKILLHLLFVGTFWTITNLQCVFAQNIDNQKLVDSLIAVYNKPYPNDSARVEIIYKLGQINKKMEFGCGRCVQFLIEKVDARFFYGDGISSGDQEKGAAARAQLIGIVAHHPKRWSILQSLFDALKTKDRNEKFIHNIYLLLITMSNASTSKAIVEFEILTIGTDPNYKRAYPSYQKNLKTLLGMFE